MSLEKDLRTLLFDGDAAMKVYFVRDRIKKRAKIDKIIQSYLLNPATTSMLRDLKIVPLPEGFDADSEAQRVDESSHPQDSLIRSLVCPGFRQADIAGCRR
jgi:hypothetical protein